MISIKFNGVRDAGLHVGPTRVWVAYNIVWDYAELMRLDGLFGTTTDNLYQLLDLFGVGSTLTIAGIAGTLIEPENTIALTYPNGDPLEQSYQWLWQPCDRAALEKDLNVYVNEPKRFFENATTIFKDGVAMRQVNPGRTAVTVDVIAMHRLPDLIKPRLAWEIAKES
jgi:hypothetical protein